MKAADLNLRALEPPAPQSAAFLDRDAVYPAYCFANDANTAAYEKAGFKKRVTIMSIPLVAAPRIALHRPGVTLRALFIRRRRKGAQRKF